MTVTWARDYLSWLLFSSLPPLLIHIVDVFNKQIGKRSENKKHLLNNYCTHLCSDRIFSHHVGSRHFCSTLSFILLWPHFQRQEVYKAPTFGQITQCTLCHHLVNNSQDLPRLPAAFYTGRPIPSLQGSSLLSLTLASATAPLTDASAFLRVLHKSTDLIPFWKVRHCGISLLWCSVIAHVSLELPLYHGFSA